LDTLQVLDHVGFFFAVGEERFQMTRFLGVLAVLFILFAGIGYYRGWFHAKSNDSNGQGTVTFTVDKDKLDKDKTTVQKDAQDLGHK